MPPPTISRMRGPLMIRCFAPYAECNCAVPARPARLTDPAEQSRSADQRSAGEHADDIAGPVAATAPAAAVPDQLDLRQRRLIGRAAARRLALLDPPEQRGDAQQRLRILADPLGQRRFRP